MLFSRYLGDIYFIADLWIVGNIQHFAKGCLQIVIYCRPIQNVVLLCLCVVPLYFGLKVTDLGYDLILLVVELDGMHFYSFLLHSLAVVIDFDFACIGHELWFCETDVVDGHNIEVCVMWLWWRWVYDFCVFEDGNGYFITIHFILVE